MKSSILKQRIRYRLIIVVVVNVITFLILQKWLTVTAAFQLIDSTKLQSLIEAAIPASILGIAVSLLSGQLSDLAKARLVFWKWRNPLPGCRAFSKHAIDDPRVDETELRKIVDPWPQTPEDQNKCWYRLYRLVSDDSVVIYQHKEYLFMRDWAAMAILTLPFVLACCWLFAVQNAVILATAAILVLQYLLAKIAARNFGIRFVTAVLTAATHSKPAQSGS